MLSIFPARRRAHQHVAPTRQRSQIVEICVVERRPRAPVVIADLHVEGLGATCDSFAYCAHPQYPQTLARHIRRKRNRRAPDTRPAQAVQRTKIAHGGNQHAHGVVGDTLVVGAASVGDGDATRVCGRDVDALKAGAHARYQPQLGKRVHLVGAQTEQADGQHGVEFSAARLDDLGALCRRNGETRTVVLGEKCLLGGGDLAQHKDGNRHRQKAPGRMARTPRHAADQ